MAPSSPRQGAKLVICLHKMLTTCSTVLIFGSGPLVSKTMHVLTVVPVAKCVVSMLSCTVTRVFL